MLKNQSSGSGSAPAWQLSKAELTILLSDKRQQLYQLQQELLALPRKQRKGQLRTNVISVETELNELHDAFRMADNGPAANSRAVDTEAAGYEVKVPAASEEVPPGDVDAEATACEEVSIIIEPLQIQQEVGLQQHQHQEEQIQMSKTTKQAAAEYEQKIAIDADAVTAELQANLEMERALRVEAERQLKECDACLQRTRREGEIAISCVEVESSRLSAECKAARNSYEGVVSALEASEAINQTLRGAMFMALPSDHDTLPVSTAEVTAQLTTGLADDDILFCSEDFPATATQNAQEDRGTESVDALQRQLAAKTEEHSQEMAAAAAELAAVQLKTQTGRKQWKAEKSQLKAAMESTIGEVMKEADEQVLLQTEQMLLIQQRADTTTSQQQRLVQNLRSRAHELAWEVQQGLEERSKVLCVESDSFLDAEAQCVWDVERTALLCVIETKVEQVAELTSQLQFVTCHNTQLATYNKQLAIEMIQYCKLEQSVKSTVQLSAQQIKHCTERAAALAEDNADLGEALDDTEAALKSQLTAAKSVRAQINKMEDREVQLLAEISSMQSELKNADVEALSQVAATSAPSTNDNDDYSQLFAQLLAGSTCEGGQPQGVQTTAESNPGGTEQCADVEVRAGAKDGTDAQIDDDILFFVDTDDAQLAEAEYLKTMAQVFQEVDNVLPSNDCAAAGMTQHPSSEVPKLEDPLEQTRTSPTTVEATAGATQLETGSTSEDLVTEVMDKATPATKASSIQSSEVPTKKKNSKKKNSKKKKK